MANTSTPRKRRWWLVPLAFVLLLTTGVLAYRSTHLEQWSWFWASRNFIGADIDATSEDNIYVAGNFILHYDGTRWSRAVYPFEKYDLDKTLELCCPRGYRSFAGLFVRPWQEFYCTSQVNDIEIYDETHVYAVGRAGILQSDGVTWSAMPIAEGLVPSPYGLWVQNPNSIYALDSDLGLLYWDGQIWDVLTLPFSFKVNSVGGTTEHAVITGEGPTLLIQKDGSWELVDITPFIDDIELHQTVEEDYGLQPYMVWALESGDIIVEIREQVYYSPLWIGYRMTTYNTRALLLYQNDEWSRINTPEWWQPLEIQSYDGDTFIAYQNVGNIWYYFSKAAGTSYQNWTACSPRIYPELYGFLRFVEQGHLVVYGGEIDAYGNGTTPCRVEYYDRLLW